MKIYMVKKAKDKKRNKKKVNRKIKKSIDLLGEAKDQLRDSPVTKKILKKFNLKNDIIDGMVLRFEDDLDVTAKTVNGEVTLNKSLIEKSFDTLMRYVIHEFVHVCQHIKNQKGKSKKSKTDKTYLDNPEEIEAFKWQSLHTKIEEGEKELDKYLDDLMKYHDMPKGKAKKKKKQLKDYLE